MHCRAASTVITLLTRPPSHISIKPNLCLHRTRTSLSSAINTILGSSHTLLIHSLHVQTISILSNPLYSLTPFLFQLFYTHLFIPNSIHSWHSSWRRTSSLALQKLHLKNIHFPSLSTSHTPCLCSVQRNLYNYSLLFQNISFLIKFSYILTFKIISRPISHATIYGLIQMLPNY